MLLMKGCRNIDEILITQEHNTATTSIQDDELDWQAHDKVRN